MEVLKMITMVVYIILGIALLILCFINSKQSDGASSITGVAQDSFYGKNKEKTSEAKMDKLIIILSIIFIALTVATYFF